jgi:hypothetical protein
LSNILSRRQAKRPPSVISRHRRFLLVFHAHGEQIPDPRARNGKHVESNLAWEKRRNCGDRVGAAPRMPYTSVGISHRILPGTNYSPHLYPPVILPPLISLPKTFFLLSRSVRVGFCQPFRSSARAWSLGRGFEKHRYLRGFCSHPAGRAVFFSAPWDWRSLLGHDFEISYPGESVRFALGSAFRLVHGAPPIRPDSGRQPGTSKPLFPLGPVYPMGDAYRFPRWYCAFSWGSCFVHPCNYYL